MSKHTNDGPQRANIPLALAEAQQIKGDRDLDKHDSAGGRDDGLPEAQMLELDEVRRREDDLVPTQAMRNL